MSRMAIAIPLAALAAFAALAAVALSGGSDSPTGDSMEAKVIELESNPTTGYSWAIYYSDGLHVESEFVPSSTGLVGAPGKQVFTITADSPGTYHFKAEYKRSWETVDPIQVYEEDLEFRCGSRHKRFPRCFPSRCFSRASESRRLQWVRQCHEWIIWHNCKFSI